MIRLKNTIKQILNEYTNGIKNILGNRLTQIILYGSYARGDYNSSSDMDIMILVDMSDTEIDCVREKISGLAFDIGLEYDITISTIIKNQNHFEQWFSVVPFYKNVKEEGVIISG